MTLPIKPWIRRSFMYSNGLKGNHLVVWCCCGAVLVLLWCCWGVVSVLLGCCFGVVGVLFRCCWHVVVVLLWCCYRVFLVLLGCCYDVVVLLKCCYGAVGIFGVFLYVALVGDEENPQTTAPQKIYKKTEKI